MKRNQSKPVFSHLIIALSSILISFSNNSPVALKFTALDGREVDVEKMKGKMILIDCWATWCGPCLQEMEHIKKLYNKYHQKGFEVIGISMDATESKARVMRIVESKGIPWPQRFEGKGFQEDSFRKQFQIKSLPTVLLLDRGGNIVDMNARGARLEALLEEYLGK